MNNTQLDELLHPQCRTIADIRYVWSTGLSKQKNMPRMRYYFKFEEYCVLLQQVVTKEQYFQFLLEYGDT